MERTKVKLSICGSDYFIYTDDDVNYVKELGNKLDERLSKLVHENSRFLLHRLQFGGFEYADSA